MSRFSWRHWITWRTMLISSTCVWWMLSRMIKKYVLLASSEYHQICKCLHGIYMYVLFVLSVYEYLLMCNIIVQVSLLPLSISSSISVYHFHLFLTIPSLSLSLSLWAVSYTYISYLNSSSISVACAANQRYCPQGLWIWIWIWIWIHTTWSI